MGMDSRLRIIDLCGPHCVGKEDGETLFKALLPLVETGEPIRLDFEGIVTITSSFLNASLGRIIGRMPYEEFTKRVRWENVDRNDDELIRLVIENAREHFSKSKGAQQTNNNIVDQSLEQD